MDVNKVRQTKSDKTQAGQAVNGLFHHDDAGQPIFMIIVPLKGVQ